MPSTSVQIEPTEQFAPGTLGRLMVLEVIKRVRPGSVTKDEETELEQLRRRHHTPKTFTEEIEWEREFGAEAHAENERRNGRPASPGFWRERWRWQAAHYGMSYTEVKAAYRKVWAEGEAKVLEKGSN